MAEFHGGGGNVSPWETFADPDEEWILASLGPD